MKKGNNKSANKKCKSTGGNGKSNGNGNGKCPMKEQTLLVRAANKKFREYLKQMQKDIAQENCTDWLNSADQ